MTISDINRLAKEQGVHVKDLSKGSNIAFEYTFPYKSDHKHLYKITVTFPKGTPAKPSGQSCMLKLLYPASYARLDRYDREMTFYMEQLTEAFGLIYVFLMYPDKIRYEMVKGKESKSLTEKEFAGLGKKRYGKMSPLFPALFVSVMRFFIIFAEIALLPLGILFKNTHYMRINNSRKWEYIAVPGEKEYTLIKRYCAGAYKRLTRKEPWMHWEEI